ncbi:MAG: prolipoprotein diacylglyceryl transferase [Clostridia bacterium]|nr:prolipoprotein diacylglyceryl transferase [Clostridia bacterium]
MHPYGICLAASILVGLLVLFLCDARKIKDPIERKNCIRALTVFAVLAIPLGLFFGRLAFALARFAWFRDRGLAWLFQLQNGGFMLYGVVAGLLLACVLSAKICRIPFSSIADLVAAPALLTLSLERFSEYLVQVGYGYPLSDWFSVWAFSPDEYTSMSYFHLKDIRFLERFPFAMIDSHYGEAMWAVCVLMGLITLCLFFILRHHTFRRAGDRTLIALSMVIASTIAYESMRQDDVTKWGVTGVVRAVEVIGAVLLLLVMLWAQIRMQPPRKVSAMVLSWIYLLLCMGMVICMEFALERKIMFLLWMRMDLCYLVMLLSCAGMVHAVSLTMLGRQPDRLN